MFAAADLAGIQGERAEAEGEARKTVPDGPFERKIKPGIVGGAEGFAEHMGDRCEAVGQTKRDGVSDLLHFTNIA